MKTLIILLLTSAAAMAQNWVGHTKPLKPAQLAFDKLAKDNVSVRAEVINSSADGIKNIKVDIRNNTLGALTIECAIVYKIDFGNTWINVDASVPFEQKEGVITLTTQKHPDIKGWLIRVLKDGRVVGVAASSPNLASAAETLDPAALIKGK